MKQSILLLLLFSFLSAKSQTPNEEVVKVIDSRLITELKAVVLKKSILDEKVKNIHFAYFDDEVLYASFQLVDTFQFYNWKDDTQYFDLNFEGDVYILNQNYPETELPLTMHVSEQTMNGVAKKDNFRIYHVSVYRDSTVYVYTKNVLLPKGVRFGALPVRYLGDLKAIEEEIALNLAKDKSILKDSVCVFELILTKQQELISGTLIGGKKSIFTDLVYDTMFLNKNRNFEDGKSKWRAAIFASSGRPFTSKFKLYAKLNKDGSVSIKLPKTLGSFTGN